jgi:hypothetical protein
MSTDPSNKVRARGEQVATGKKVLSLVQHNKIISTFSAHQISSAKRLAQTVSNTATKPICIYAYEQPERCQRSPHLRYETIPTSWQFITQVNPKHE